MIKVFCDRCGKECNGSYYVAEIDKFLVANVSEKDFENDNIADVEYRKTLCIRCMGEVTNIISRPPISPFGGVLL